MGKGFHNHYTIHPIICTPVDRVSDRVSLRIIDNHKKKDREKENRNGNLSIFGLLTLRKILFLETHVKPRVHHLGYKHEIIREDLGSGKPW